MQKEKTIKNISTFCKAYNKQANDRLKEEYFKSNISLIKDYIPYAAKMAYVKNVVDATSFNKTIDENSNITYGNRYERNGAMQYLLYTMMLIDNYTNIVVEYGNDNNPLTSQYDELKKSGLIEKLYELIPESERAEFKILLNMQNDDTYTNFASVESFVSRTIETLGTVGTTLLSPIIEVIEKMDEDKIMSIVNKIGK